MERFAGALLRLGVGPGDVVAVQLPNFWQVGALTLVGARIGAITAPILPTIRERELARVLRRIEAVVCITVDEWDGFRHAAAPSELMPELPSLRHRVVLGEAGDGAIDFAEYFAECPGSGCRPTSSAAWTRTPTGSAFSVHVGHLGGAQGGSAQLQYAPCRDSADRRCRGARSRWTSSSRRTRQPTSPVLSSITVPLLSGATSVVIDRWSGKAGRTLLRETAATMIFAAPVLIEDRATAGTMPADTPALRLVLSGATVVPPQLVRRGPDIGGLVLRVDLVMHVTDRAYGLAESVR